MVNKIVQKFAEGYTHHSRIIDYEEAKECNLDIETCEDEEWSNIWSLYMNHAQLAYLAQVTKTLEKYKEVETR